MRSLFISMAALFALSGCVSTSGALPIGKDTFSITVGVSDSWSDSENAPRAKKEALTQAGDYCKSLNKEISVQTMSGRSNSAGSSYDIIFQCLNANDPALKNRPVFTTK